jgi:hypothetical protein
MGFDPFSIAGIIAAGASTYASTRKKPSPDVPTPGAPAAPVTGETDAGKKVRKYKPPTQLFKDEDLRLGSAGKLGM